MTWRAVGLGICALAAGCAREREPRMPGQAGWFDAPPIALRAQETRSLDLPATASPTPAIGVPTARYGEPALPGAGAAPPPAPLVPPHLSSAAIPDGSACTAELDRLGVRYERMESERGVKTPVVVLGPVGGIEYRAFAKVEFVADCRLVVALAWIAPILQSEGVSAARFSGAYSYRMSRVGRLSLHAYGLAIDLHEWKVDGRWLTVRHDFARGLTDGCAASSPALDRVACRLKALGLFRELLTPDSNADHYNHFHFGILPTGTTLAMLPRAPKPKRAKPKPVPQEHHPLLQEEQAGIQLLEEPDPEPPAHTRTGDKDRHRAAPATPKKDAKRARRAKPLRHRRRAEKSREHEKRHRTGDRKKR